MLLAISSYFSSLSGTPTDAPVLLSGDNEADCLLAITLEQSSDPKKQSQAHQIYKGLAEKNHPEALYRYGMAGMNSEDYSTRGDALNNIITAAELNHPGAMYELGSMYKNRGDYTKALEWLGKAKELHGLAMAEYKKMSSDPQIMFDLGTKYYHGQSMRTNLKTGRLEMGITRNREEGLRYFDLAARLGSREAMVCLGHIYFNLVPKGRSTNEYEEKAISYYRQAIQAEAEEPVAPQVFHRLAVLLSRKFATLKKTGDVHEYHQNREELANEMVVFLRIAATSNYPDSLTDLGKMYQEGNDYVEKDLDMARRYFEQAAADLNSSRVRTLALCHLGAMYKNGDGVAADLDRATEYYAKAAGLGDNRARQPLRDISEQYKAGKDSARFRKAHECTLAAEHLDALPQEKKRASDQLAMAENFLAKRSLGGVAATVLTNRIMQTIDDHRGSTSNVFNYFEAAAKIFPEAYMQLAQMYKDGLVGNFPRSDGETVIKFIWDAVQYGGITPSEGYKQIAQIYRDGSGIEKNEATALTYFDLAEAEAEAEADVKAEVTSPALRNASRQYDLLNEPGGIWEL